MFSEVDIQERWHRGDWISHFRCKTSPKITRPDSIASDYLDSISTSVGYGSSGLVGWYCSLGHACLPGAKKCHFLGPIGILWQKMSSLDWLCTASVRNNVMATDRSVVYTIITSYGALLLKSGVNILTK